MANPSFFDTIGAGAHAFTGAAKAVATLPPTKAAATVVDLPKPKTQAEHATYINKVVDDVHSGKYDEATGATVLKQAGFPDSKNPFSNAHAPGIGGTLHAIAAPLGFSRSTNERRAAETRRQWVLQHPGEPTTEQPGVPDVVGVGPGATFGLGRQLLYQGGQNLTYAPGGVAAFVEDPGKTLGELGHNLLNPNPIDAAVYGYLALHGGATGISRGLAAGRVLRGAEDLPVKSIDVQPGAHPRAPDVTVTRQGPLRTAVTRSSAKGGSLLHTPPPTPYMIHVPGARPTTPTGEVAEGPRPEGIHVARPVPRAALARPLSRGRSKIIQSAVERDARAPGIPVGGGRRLGAKLNARVAQTVSSRKTVAREIRAGRRTDLALANSTPVALDHALAKLSPAQHEAITIASIAGDAALDNPAEAAGKQMAQHQHWFEVGGKTENLRAISDIEAGQKELQAALDNPGSRDSKKLLNALALAKEESKRQEDALVEAGHLTPETVQGRHDNAAAAYGYDRAQPGSFFISQSTRYLPTDMPSPVGGVRAAPTAVPPPQPGTRVPGLHQEMTGESYAGGYRAGPSVIARRGVLVNRLLSVERQYQDLWKIASPQRKSIYDIGVRDTPAIREEIRNFFNELHDRIHANPEESGQLTSEQVQRVSELLQMRDPTALTARVGSEIPGVRWVDSRYLADLGGTLNGVGIYRLADAINNPLRFSQLYLRPAYILNLAGNLGMNGITEGVRVFPALRSAAAANRLYGDDLTRWIDGGMGASLSRSYSVGRGVLGHQSDKIAEAWNGITDLHARRGAFFGEAARNGIKTRQQLQALKAAKPGSALAAKRTLIFRAANKNIVDFGSLTPVEANEVRRLIYFYPWVSRGSMWALRALVEHPLKSFTLYELGKIGAANAHRAFGQHLAQWFNAVGAVPFGGDQGDIRYAANFSSINTSQTLVGAAHTISDTVKGLAGLPQGGGLGQALTPAGTAFMQAGTANPTGAGQTGIPGLIAQQPIYAMLHRLGLVGKPSKTHPVTGLAQGILPFVIGGAYPQPTSHSALAKGAVKGARTPHGKLEIELDQLAEEGVMSQDAANTAKDHLHAIPAKGITYIRNMMGPRLDLAQKIDQWVTAGKVSQEQAAQVKASLLTMTPKQIDEARKALAVGLGQKPAPGPVPVG